MASSTSQYAAGDLVHRTTKDSKDVRTLESIHGALPAWTCLCISRDCLVCRRARRYPGGSGRRSSCMRSLGRLSAAAAAVAIAWCNAAKDELRLCHSNEAAGEKLIHTIQNQLRGRALVPTSSSTFAAATCTCVLAPRELPVAVALAAARTTPASIIRPPHTPLTVV